MSSGSTAGSPVSGLLTSSLPPSKADGSTAALVVPITSINDNERKRRRDIGLGIGLTVFLLLLVGIPLACFFCWKKHLLMFKRSNSRKL